MSYSVATIANAFLELARRENKDLTNMKLQKLVYIAQGFSLAMLGEPLFQNSIHAFQWGPVIPNLYEAVKQYGGGPISSDIPTDDPPMDVDDPGSTEAAIVKSVWQRYGSLSAAQLSTITHKEGTPWSRVWNKLNYGVIPPSMIQDHYNDLLAKV